MTVDDIITEVQEHEFDDFTPARILSLVNDSYYEICAREPWPFLETFTTTITTSGGSITSPTDIGKIISIRDVDNNITLKAARPEDINQMENTQNNTGHARYFYTVANTYYLYPAGEVAASPNLVVSYIKIPAALEVGGSESSILLPKMHHRMLVLGAASKAYYMTDDSQLGFYYRQQFEERMQHMRSDLWTKHFEGDVIHDVYGDDY